MSHYKDVKYNNKSYDVYGVTFYTNTDHTMYFVYCPYQQVIVKIIFRSPDYFISGDTWSLKRWFQEVHIHSDYMQAFIKNVVNYGITQESINQNIFD